MESIPIIWVNKSKSGALDFPYNNGDTLGRTSYLWLKIMYFNLHKG